MNTQHVHRVTLRAGTVLTPHNSYHHEVITLTNDICVSVWRTGFWDEDTGGNRYRVPEFWVQDAEWNVLGNEENSLRGAIYDWALEARRNGKTP